MSFYDESAQSDDARLKALAAHLTHAAVVVARDFDAFLFALDPDGYVLDRDESTYIAARACGFAPVAVIGLTPEGTTESESLPGAINNMLMDRAICAFRAMVREHELERLASLPDIRGAASA